MTSIFRLTSLLAMTNEAWRELAAIAFTLASFVATIFFVYQLFYYTGKGLKALFGSMSKSKAGQVIFSPAVGIPIAIIVSLLLFYLLIVFGVIDLTPIIEFFVEILTP